MTQHYLGVLGLAEALGVSRHAVHKWRARYPATSSHPFPAPDVDVDGMPGWSPRRVDDVMQWRENLPGRGAGGGRPTAVRRQYFAAANARGLTEEEATRALATFVEEMPHMSEPEVCAWLIGKWRD